jgi:serine phosphatase RsbU (regulator of sigma subunit)
LLICEPLNGIGICANEFGKHDTALKVFLTELNIEKKLKREVLYLSYYNIANTYVLMKQFHLAEQYLDSALKTKNEDPTFYLESLYLQMEISIKKGDIDKALKIRDRFFSFKDSLNNQEIKKEVAKMNAMYNLEKKELEKQKLIDEKKQQEYIIVASIITIILCFALVVFMLKAYRVKQKANIELSRKNQIIEMQKKLVEEQNKNITDSIHYASKIQQALLSSDEYLNKHLFELVNEYFVLYIPKDIVSGDFYWATKKNNYFYFVVGDSTGHGVPGAFMSLLNINFLNEAINDKNIPNTGEIFDFVKSKLNDHLHGSKDGMDASIIRWDINDKTSIQYSAANHSPILIPKDSNTYFKCENDKMPIGVDDYSVNNFRSFNLKLNRGDKFYIFTDGYADQFGGEKSRKLQKTKFYELLLKTSSLSLTDQKSYLLNFFYHWKGDEEQTDDVCIACFKF